MSKRAGDRQQGLARALHQRLVRALDGVGVALSVHGQGVHWHVEASHGDRACRTHCFDTPQGDEYYLELAEGGHRRATGRTAVSDEVVAALRSWLIDHLPLDQMHVRHAFVDAALRARRALAARLDHELAALGSALRIEEVGGLPGSDASELWIDHAERAAQLRVDGDGAALVCFLDRMPVVVGAGMRADAAALALVHWFEGRMAAAPLAAAVPGLVADPDAALVEQGQHARWRWMQFRRDGDDRTRAPYRPLLDGILASPVVSAFYTFASMGALAFSRCPHYPFDVDGLPTIYPREGGYVAQLPAGDPYQCEPATTVAWLEAVLAEHVGEVYVGSAYDRIPAQLDAELAARGSALRARLVHRGGASSVTVQGPDGMTVEVRPRRPRTHVELVTAAAGEGVERRFTGSFGDAAATVIDWLSGS